MSLTSLSWGEAQSRYTRSLCLWSALWFKAGLSFWSMQVTKAHSQSLLEDMVTVALSCFTWKEEDVQSLARLYGGKITAPSGWEHRAGGFRQLRDTQRQMATSLRVNGSAQGVRIRQLFSQKCGASDTQRCWEPAVLTLCSCTASHHFGQTFKQLLQPAADFWTWQMILGKSISLSLITVRYVNRAVPLLSSAKAWSWHFGLYN